MDQSPEEIALSKAKIGLMSTNDSAFFTYLAFSLKHSFNDKIRTARTDGTMIEYSPKFFMELSHDERIFLILHEAMHCAYLHMVRAEMFDKRRFNRAADHAINLQLIDRGFKMPECGLANPQYKDMSAEEIYYLLPAEESGDDNGIGDDLDAPNVDDPNAAEEIQKQMEDILVQASIQSKMANDKPGTIPGDIEIFLKKLLDPQLPWQRILQKYIQSYAKSDYSFRKPNKRFFPSHYMPSMFSESLIDLALFVDTSGSVTDQEFHHFISETAAMLRMMKPSKITIGQFDTTIKSVDDVKDIRDLMNVRFTGRGGTLIDPVINWANENKPQLLLIFSDGEFRQPSIETKSDTLWLIHNRPQFSAPFGKVIHYQMKS